MTSSFCSGSVTFILGLSQAVKARTQFMYLPYHNRSIMLIYNIRFWSFALDTSLLVQCSRMFAAFPGGCPGVALPGSCLFLRKGASLHDSTNLLTLVTLATLAFYPT